MSRLSAHDRPAILSDLRSTRYDLLIIGGGITGVGIALDAASRGLKTALLEKADFASGTSSRSTKLIHGGLRYLKQFEIALVREVGRERAIVHKLAPHLVTAERMLLPLIKDGTFGKIVTSFGLMVYDVLAGVESEDQRQMLSKEETLDKEPLLDESRLEGGGVYAEYRTDDARLTIEVMKTAVQYGAICLNYLEAKDFVYNENHQVSGVRVKDVLQGDDFTMEAGTVVSAAGPWVDEMRSIDHSLKGKRLHLTKGVHIVVARDQLPVRQAVYFDVPDGRMIFAIPRGGVTYIGTTDTDYEGDKNHVVANQEDVDYLLEAVNHAFPNISLKRHHVFSSWAGLRPLIHEEGKSSSELSRKDEIFISDTGLISIAGGKLTGYRKMAERITDLVVRKHEKQNPHITLKECKTDEIALCGGEFASAEEVKRYQKDISRIFDINEYDAYYLVSNYGRQADIILKNREELSELGLLLAECDFCMSNELAMTLSDFFIRRTGRLYFDIGSVREHYRCVAEKMKAVLHWTTERLSEEVDVIEMALHEASHFNEIDNKKI